MITLRQLRYLASLARHRHFGRAAAECAVTQPALSMQIRELEREIDAELVERRPGEVVLTDTGLDVPAHLRSFNVRWANETQQEAVLTVLLYVKLVPGSWGRVAEAICPPPGWALPPSLNLTPISQPFALAPGAAVTGQLVFEIPRYYLDSLANPPEARLEIADEVSGKKMSAPAELGQYDKDTMTAAAGGVAMLGPEYEAAPTRQPDAGAPSA